MSAGMLAECYVSVQEDIYAGEKIRTESFESEELIYGRCLGRADERSVHIDPLLGL